MTESKAISITNDTKKVPDGKYNMKTFDRRYWKTGMRNPRESGNPVFPVSTKNRVNVFGTMVETGEIVAMGNINEPNKGCSTPIQIQNAIAEMDDLIDSGVIRRGTIEVIGNWGEDTFRLCADFYRGLTPNVPEENDTN